MQKEIKYKVNKNNCHICKSHHLDEEGYPCCRRNGRTAPIYRHIFWLYKRPPKAGMVIRHTCDNRLCINPEHLIAGTHADNVCDRVKRGRSASGEHNGRSKLTSAQALAIYKDRTTSKSALAKKYGIDRQVIRKIQRREIWKSAIATF